MRDHITPEQLAAQFDAYAAEGFDAPPGSTIARIADAWSCAARQVRTKLANHGDENERLQERVASLEETNRLLEYQVKLVDLSNEALRGMVDTLNIENTKLKGLGT